MMMMSSSPSHRKSLHGSISSYSDSDEGSSRRDFDPIMSPSSSSFYRDRSSIIEEEEGKTSNVNEGDEDKDSELAASERQQVDVV